MLLHTILLAACALIPQDYECSQEEGCDATRNVDGELVTESFRKHDIISTEAGWVISSGEGWVKLKTSDSAFFPGGNFSMVGVTHFSPVPSPLPWGFAL